jgi:aspartate racemase
MNPATGTPRLGIVGGTGPESTIDYYRKAIWRWRAMRPDGTYPEIVIASVDGGTVIRQLGERAFEEVGRTFGEALVGLETAGCDLALIASNAGHLAYDHLEPAPRIDTIHIVDAALDDALRAGYRRLGIIGTRFVVKSDLYPSRFGPAGIDVIAPTDAELTVVHDIYLGELVEGLILDASRARIVEVIRSMRDRDRIDGVVLGGTELALTLTAPTYVDVPVLDTARIHVETAIERLVGTGGRRPSD